MASVVSSVTINCEIRKSAIREMNLSEEFIESSSSSGVQKSSIVELVDLILKGLVSVLVP